MTSSSNEHGSSPLKFVDTVLLGWYLLFGAVALTFEPAYYFGCEWSGRLCPAAEGSPLMRVVRDLWMIYAHWDPLFLDVPLWLRVLCSIEVFVFGPLYLVTAWGIWRRAPWLSSLALPFSGALVYSTGVYFAMELLEAMPGTNMFMVFAVNLPWTIVPLVLMWRCTETRGEANISSDGKNIRREQKKNT
jgi:hypothetical protein